MNLLITQLDMMRTINNHLTGLLESATCSGETPFNAEGSYRLFNNFFKDGRDLNVSGTFILHGYSNYDTGRISPLLSKKANCNELIIGMYKRLTQ